MKKFFVVLLALFIAVPAISYAGSVTSRYDVTIGGYVKFDVGYQSQSISGIDYRIAARESGAGFNQILADEYPSVNWYGGETRLNFAIKGPDAGGAKTSAFIEGDFRGVAGTRFQGTGYFTLRHAFMKFDWANTSILLGHTWQAWGLQPSFNILSFSENHFNKGATRVPQIRLTQKFLKEFSMVLALSAPTQTLWGNNGGNYEDDQTRGLLPESSLEFIWRTPRCGQIGPWMLQFGLGGMVGREKVTYNINTAANPYYKDTDMTKWGASLYGYIPIIPEKKGNKTNALGFSGTVFTGQGLNQQLPAYPGGGAFGVQAYDRTGFNAIGNGAVTVLPVEARYPVTVGYWAQLNYYFTHAWQCNLLYGAQRNAFSYTYSRNNVNTQQFVSNWIANVLWDVNPAIRVGLEYSHIKTQYGWFVNNSRTGHFDAIRFGAFYFF